MEPTFEDAKRALGDLYSTEHGNRYICPLCHSKSVEIKKGNRKEWVVTCWHKCDQNALYSAVRERAGGTTNTAPAPAVPPAAPASPTTTDNSDEGHKLVPYTLAAYAKEKVDIPEDWLVGNFELKDTLYSKVPCVAIPWPDGSTTQFRFGDGHKRFKARTSPGLYVPAYQKEYVAAEEIEYCFITEGASNTHTIAWATSHPVVGSPSKSWQERFTWDDAFDACTTIYAIQDPPPKNQTHEDTGRAFVQKIANSFDKTVYAVRFWEPDGKGYYTGPKDANELWLSTAHLGDSTKTNARHVAFNDAMMAAVTRAEIVAPEKSAEWGKPGALDDVLLPVPSLRLDYLPPCLRALVQDTAERLSCPADLVAATCVTAVAGAVGGRAHVYPKANDKTWKVPLNLWGAMVANPSQKKSPIYNAMLEPMIEVQTGWSRQNEEALRVWNAKTKGGQIKDVEKPRRKMVHTGDATIEALQDLMAENPQGLFYTRDELSGWLADLEKKGHESDRKFFLTMWQGGKYPVNRVGRGDVYAYILCSLFGSFQPATIKTFLGMGIEDGLFQRVQVLVWPDPMRPLRVDRTPNQAAIDSFKHVVTLLLSLPDHALRFDFDPAAQEVFNDWYDEHTATIDRETYGPKIQHLTKYHSLMPLLAALFQLSDTVSNTTAPPTPSPVVDTFGPNPYDANAPAPKAVLEYNQLIDPAHARQAVAFCTYLAGHLNRVYGNMPQPWHYPLSQLKQKLENGMLGAEFSTSDLMRKGWSGLTDRQQVQTALAMLETKDWIRPAPATPATGKGGDRRSKKWLVNPAVLPD